VLVYFYGLSERWQLPAEEELREQLKLRPVARENDGAVYIRDEEKR
jgi:hypothetical protein